MTQKSFEDVQGLKDDPVMQKAVLDAWGQPDNFIESATGATVPGPPDPQTPAEEKALSKGLTQRLIESQNGNGDIAENGELRWD